MDKTFTGSTVRLFACAAVASLTIAIYACVAEAQDVDAITGATVAAKLNTAPSKAATRKAKSAARLHARKVRVHVPVSGRQGRAARGDFEPGC